MVTTATEPARFTGQHLIAPQTILVRAYREQIFAGLRGAGLDVFHVVLDASEEVLRQRIQGSGEAGLAPDHLAEYRSSRAWMIRAAALAVDTGCRTPAQIAHQIASALPEPMRTRTPWTARPAANERILPAQRRCILMQVDLPFIAPGGTGKASQAA